jgi:hypothetical protein
MTGPDDYLWNRSGAADAEIEHLESVLKPYALRTHDLDWSLVSVDSSTFATRTTSAIKRGLYLTGAFAAILMVVGGVLIRSRFDWTPGSPWKVSTLAGRPQITGTGASRNTLAVGQSLITDTVSRARIRVAHLGIIEIEPNSEIRLVSTGSKHHRVTLQHGTISAHMWAPPFSFEVGTPSADLFDLGCAFVLHAEPSGAGWVRVTSGWVQFEAPGRKILIPAGAESLTRPNVGPGTPYYLDSDPLFRAAIMNFDAAANEEGQKLLALQTILQNARTRDAFTLFTVLTELPRSQREPVLQRLEEFVPLPGGYTANEVLDLHADATDAYWKELKIGNPKSWIMNWRDVLSD